MEENRQREGGDLETRAEECGGQPDPECDPEEELDRDVERRRHGFGAGFFAGMVTALAFVGIFLIGWSAARYYSVRKDGQEAEERGAEVLTDKDTLYKLDEIQALIEESYLEDIDGELLSASLFKGVAAGLGDVYANYYTAEELESVMDSSRGEYTGIGAVLEIDPDSGVITVKEVYAGGPAAAAGLLEGDILLRVGAENAEGKGLDEVVALIKGAEDTFTLAVYRPSEEQEVELSITCGSVEIPAVESRMVTDTVGYIRITEFTESAVAQFTQAAESLQGQGMEKLVVDLRDNPGGLLTSVCDILDEVLPEKLLVYTEDRDGNREEYYSDKKRTVDGEIAVLVDGNSASASEIFAGAIQDYQVGPIVGGTTYGKGVVQKTFPLSDGSAFKMTVEKYYTPLGQEIDGNGITPDIPVEEAGEAEDPGDGISSSIPEGTEEDTEDGVPSGIPEETEENTEGGDHGAQAKPSGGAQEPGQGSDPALDAAVEALESGNWKRNAEAPMQAQADEGNGRRTRQQGK